MANLQELYRKYGLEVIQEEADRITLQTATSIDNIDLLRDEIAFFSGKSVDIQTVEFSVGRAHTPIEKLPFLSSVDTALTFGFQHGASDIHFEKYDSHCRVRYRIDGILLSTFRIRESEYPSILNKIKIQAGLDISEKRLPQDGRIVFKASSENVELRVSTIPALRGEKVVLRYLRSDAEKLRLERIGLNDEQLKFLTKKLNNPSGLILVSGPTGSGKTTTLYSVLTHLNNGLNNIVSIEDPVEYTFEGINQVQLKESIGLTFPKALRSFLRQDPDIIMVGEIRDLDTAQMAIRASLTGHLVLSTIHANSTVGVVNRLVDMGIPYYQVKSALRLAVSQRLVRTYCPKCRGAGCEECYETGYKGRKAVFEFFDPQELNNIENASKLGAQVFNFKGGGMKDQLKALINLGATSQEAIQPIFDEFE